MNQPEGGHTRCIEWPVPRRHISGSGSSRIHRNLGGRNVCETDTAPGSYGWWHFDAHPDNGSSPMIVFYTKSPLTPDYPLEPFVSVNLGRRH